MSDLNLLALSPYFALTATAVMVLLVSTFTHNHRVSAGLSAAGLVAALVCTLVVAASEDRRATFLLRLDDFSLYFMGVLLVASLAVIAVSFGYLDRTERKQAEFYVLLTLATLGAAVVLASAHFASFFLGLEVLSVSLYGLIAYPTKRLLALEAGIKYLVLAGVTSATLLFGMALVYAVTGDMSLKGLLAGSPGLAGWEAAAYAVGLVLVFTGVGFKLALVPFHFWTPDVYQGSPAPTTAFLASVSKVAAFVVLLRFVGPLDTAGDVLPVVLAVVAYASMFAGNLLALLQRNVKRLLAYSSIAQVGYLIVALIAGGGDGAVAVAFYLSVYVLALIAAFGIVGVFSRGSDEAEDESDYRGLGHRRPVLAVALTISMLSLAGVPLTAGFIGKFLIFRAGAEASLWGLLIVLAVTSAMSVYYYLRVVITMFRSADAGSPQDVGADRLATATVALLSVVTVALGVYPAPLLRLIESVMAGSG